MKTLPIVYLGMKDTQETLLRALVMLNRNKINGIVIPEFPKQEQDIIQKLISEKLEQESSEILKKLKQFNKKFFGK